MVRVPVNLAINVPLMIWLQIKHGLPPPDVIQSISTYYTALEYFDIQIGPCKNEFSPIDGNVRFGTLLRLHSS